MFLVCPKDTDPISGPETVPQYDTSVEHFVHVHYGATMWGRPPVQSLFSDRARCFSDRKRFSIRPAGSGLDLRTFSMGPGLVLDRTYKRQKSGPVKVEGSQERLLKAQETISTPHNSVLEGPFHSKPLLTFEQQPHQEPELAPQNWVLLSPLTSKSVSEVLQSGSGDFWSLAQNSTATTVDTPKHHFQPSKVGLKWSTTFQTWV